MDWFERITGFHEGEYGDTQSRLSVKEGRLTSCHFERTWAIGTLETPTLADLRERAANLITGRGPTSVECLAADVRQLHALAENAGALFQVASQFNLLEMAGPSVTPEDGVTRYQYDRTQGPACALAAGAATIYRNYLVPLGGSIGQHRDEQIDCLSDIGEALGNNRESLWTMRNGYALCTEEGLKKIDHQVDELGDEGLDILRGRLRIGIHWNVEATDMAGPGHLVSQAFCSALPVAYSGISAPRWSRFARLVLEATYEATLLAAAINSTKTVFLTRVGGGAFGNETEWIHTAIRRAVGVVKDAGLDVRLVTYGSVSNDLTDLMEHFRRL